MLESMREIMKIVLAVSGQGITLEYQYFLHQGGVRETVCCRESKCHNISLAYRLKSVRLTDLEKYNYSLADLNN